MNHDGRAAADPDVRDGMPRPRLAPAEGPRPGFPGRPAPGRGSPTAEREQRTRRHWLREPRSAVWLVLALILGIGGGRRLRWSLRARRAVARLADPAVTPDEIEATAAFGREGAWELLRIFSTPGSNTSRDAAGRALAQLWKDNQLVAEEEQAVVRRGFAVEWKARRRYPRALHAEIPFRASYGVPFLGDDDDTERIRAADLEWSHRVVGARRATLENASPWSRGGGEVAFSIFPDDFPTNGPHRLVLQSRVRTAGLPDAWELDLPHVPFSFDFDPVLRPDAILTLPDATRDVEIAGAIRLRSAEHDDEAPARLVPMGDDWVLRNPPRLVVETPLVCDLAHAVSIELEGVDGRLAAGRVIVSGQGFPREKAGAPATSEITFELQPIAGPIGGAIERPGTRRIRAILDADPQLGWADPDVRAVWPGSVATDWVEVEIIRR
ncbi:MAG: hypothetical protein ACYC61_23450 [Isosphaeraceae bacterium]